MCREVIVPYCQLACKGLLLRLCYRDANYLHGPTFQICRSLQAISWKQKHETLELSFACVLPGPNVVSVVMCTSGYASAALSRGSGGMFAKQVGHAMTVW